MSFNANWDISGTNINTAGQAFTKSAESAIKRLKKHESKLNQRFKEHLSINMQRSGMDADNFSDVFELHIGDGSVNFINTAPLITQRYEYGYYNGSNDTTEEYYEEYMIETSPRYFIRPAIQETLVDIGNIILDEAKREYENNH